MASTSRTKTINAASGTPSQRHILLRQISLDQSSTDEPQVFPAVNAAVPEEGVDHSASRDRDGHEPGIGELMATLRAQVCRFRILRGVIIPTRVDVEAAKAQQPYEGLPFEISVDRIEPEKVFAFRWHPFAVERGVDYSREPTTLVVFTLEDVADGTMLTVTESGFERIPLARRAKAFTANEGGWTMVMTLIEKHLVQAA
jgi:hypothetical protein